MGFLLTVTFVFSSLSYLNVVSTSPALAVVPHQVSTYFQIPFVSFHQYQLWAHLSPFHSAEPYQPPPKGCEITQVHVLQRHGARYPTSSSSTKIKAALAKIQNAYSFDPKIAFMKDFVYNLGADALLTFGATQSRDIGAEHFKRYQNIISTGNLPFVRASGSERVVFSALNWTHGVALASNNKFQPQLSLILPENLNDTLDDSGCPSAGSSDPQTDEWLGIFGPPIAARLNSIAHGANISGSDIFDLMSLCPFDTVAKQKLSQVCTLFTQDDFEQWQYFGDLGKYYKTGYGQALGPVQGVGYINELIARLTNSPVRDNTQTNSTLDSNPETFPLNGTFYADFSHDNQMIAIYSAIGLFKQKVALDPTKPNDERSWRAALLVPFSAQMVTERLDCEVEASGYNSGHYNKHEGGDHKQVKTYVRILVNDALQPLDFCDADENGLCELDNFVKSQSYARNDGDGDFEKCFEDVSPEQRKS